MTTGRMFRSSTVVTAPPRRRDGLVETRGTIVRLVLAAAVLWGVLCGIGYLLTRQLQGTAFERWDASANRWLAARRTPTWNTVTHWLTYGAETLTVIGVGVVFFIALRMVLGRWRESMFLAAALAGEVTIFVLTALMIDRHRPPVSHLDSAPPTSSFPSGHVAAAITLYGALAVIAVHTSARLWVRTLAIFVALVAPVCVAFARLYRGMHFMTDVMGGVLLGLVWLVITWALILRRRRSVHP
jgi:membrane-associated phospholipid phosphatase